MAGEFEVISFLYGALAFDWRENVVLDVVFPDSDWDFNRNPVHVVAVPRSLEGYYRLDGRSPMAWPIADVIYPKRLSAGKLGIYGRLESENIFVPLLVGQRGASLEGKNLQPPRLGIRSPIPIENVFWQWGFHINGNCSNYSESNRIVNPRLHDTDSQYQFDIGEVFFFHLPVVTGEKLCIKILGQEQQSGSKKPFLIKVYLPKNNND